MTAPSRTESCKHGQEAPRDVLRVIPLNTQGGTARHGCVICAFNAGVLEGMRLQKEKRKQRDQAAAATA